MAAGTKTDFKIYHRECYGGAYEVIAQNLAILNPQSRGPIQVVTQRALGDFVKESFLKEIGVSLITLRDITAVTPVDDIPMTQGEFITPKINRRIGPVAQTLDAWRKIGANEREMSYKLGQMVGRRKLPGPRVHLSHTRVSPYFDLIVGPSYTYPAVVYKNGTPIGWVPDSVPTNFPYTSIDPFSPPWNEDP